MAGQLPGWIRRLEAGPRVMPGWLRDATAPRAYGRPGSHLVLTAEQWDLYDRFTALQQRQAGHVAEMGDGLRGVRARALL